MEDRMLTRYFWSIDNSQGTRGSGVSTDDPPTPDVSTYLVPIFSSLRLDHFDEGVKQLPDA